MREVALDTETTGLDPFEGHRIVEIGCVELVNGIPSGQSFHLNAAPMAGEVKMVFPRRMDAPITKSTGTNGYPTVRYGRIKPGCFFRRTTTAAAVIP